MTEETKLNCSVNYNYREGYQQGRADAIEEVKELMIKYTTFENVDAFVEALRSLKEKE